MIIATLPQRAWFDLSLRVEEVQFHLQRTICSNISGGGGHPNVTPTSLLCYYSVEKNTFLRLYSYTVTVEKSVFMSSSWFCWLHLIISPCKEGALNLWWTSPLVYNILINIWLLYAISKLNSSLRYIKWVGCIVQEQHYLQHCHLSHIAATVTVGN